MKQTIYKSGSSLVVVVPSEFVNVIGAKKGDSVKVSVDYDLSKVTYLFSGAKQLTLVGNSKYKVNKSKKPRRKI